MHHDVRARGVQRVVRAFRFSFVFFCNFFAFAPQNHPHPGRGTIRPTGARIFFQRTWATSVLSFGCLYDTAPPDANTILRARLRRLPPHLAPLTRIPAAQTKMQAQPMQMQAQPMPAGPYNPAAPQMAVGGVPGGGERQCTSSSRTRSLMTHDGLKGF